MDNARTIDKVLGVILMVWSVICYGCVATIFMGVGAMIGAAAAAEGGAQTGPGGMALPALFGLGGAVLGGVFIVAAVLGLVTGFGIFSGRRWAFWLGAIVWGLLAIADLMSVNIIGLVIDAAICAYSLVRLFGKFGPPPE